MLTNMGNLDSWSTPGWWNEAEEQALHTPYWPDLQLWQVIGTNKKSGRGKRRSGSSLVFGGALAKSSAYFPYPATASHYKHRAKTLFPL